MFMAFLNEINKEKGFALFYASILILAIVLAAVISISALTYNQQKVFQDIVKSSQAYYAAEAGIEDMVLRLENNMNLPNSYTFNVGAAFVINTVSDDIGGSRIITAEGNSLEKIRKIAVSYEVSTQDISFYYGAQVGDGGVIMKNGAEIRGNVFSNGSIAGLGLVTDTVIVARNGNGIEDLTVGKDAYAHSCKDSTISETLTYVSGGTIENCTAGQIIDGGTDEIQPKDFSITEDMVQNWKNEAESGGIINGDLIIEENASLGPVKIEGNLLVQNAVLTITGTIWVTGTFDTGTNVEVRLDENSYGDLSGVLVIDGSIQIRNNVILKGTSSPSSYLLIMSDDSSLSEKSPAINVSNNAVGCVLFAPNGLLKINNNVELTEATAYQLLLENNAVISYEIGLENLKFTSGPGASWEVTSWKEIE